MHFISHVAGRNAYRYIWLFMAMVFIFADTGSNGGRVDDICNIVAAALGPADVANHMVGGKYQATQLGALQGAKNSAAPCKAPQIYAFLAFM